MNRVLPHTIKSHKQGLISFYFLRSSGKFIAMVARVDKEDAVVEIPIMWRE